MATLTLNLPDEISADEAHLLLAVKLYELDRISVGRAAEIAGFSKAAFMEVASRRGVPDHDYPPGERASEFAF